MLLKLWNSIVVDTFQKIESEKEASSSFNKKVGLLFICVALSLIFIEYFGSFSFLSLFLNNLGLDGITNLLVEIKTSLNNNQLFYLGYWVAVVFSCYFIFPVLLIKLFFKEQLSNYGLSFKGIFKSYKLYIIFFLFMLPLVILVSFSESFQLKYPFYNPSGESLWPNFFIWQCLYFVQFFALEFFFRGFMLHGTKNKFGFYSIFIMMIPYCMIHFEKPMPETIAAIIAGLVLGTLSLKSKSIWLGVLIHYSVAITMDLAALYQKGYFN